MSDLGFDPRPYCERLAKAMPERFTEATVTVLTSRSTYENVWHIVDVTRPNLPVRLNLDWTLWAFFGPLADERKIDPLALYKSYDKRKQSAFYRATRDERTKWHERDFTNELLESIIAAVVESFESEAKGK